MHRRLKTGGLMALALAIVMLGGLTTSASAGDAAAGKDLYKQRCASCHGEDGKANTPIAKALKPPPRDHSDGANT